MTNQPLASIVTPVYNGEKYLAQCIESVLSQRYENWEYVIVNNRSTDRTLKIAQNYAERDARIRLHNNLHFLDLMPNWNHAMRQISAESKYCKVVHADDRLLPGCISRMVRLAEIDPQIGIIGSRYYGNHGTDELFRDFRIGEIPEKLYGLAAVAPGREVCRRTLFARLYAFGNPSSLLIRSELIRARDRFYNESNLHADAEVCFELLRHCKFGFINEDLVDARVHDDSVTSLSATPLNTILANKIQLLIRFGPVYLGRAEYEERIQFRLRQYYTFLGQSVFYFKDEQFWKFHRDNLREAGYPLSRIRLCLAAAKAFVTFLSRPRLSLQKLSRKIGVQAIGCRPQAETRF